MILAFPWCVRQTSTFITCESWLSIQSFGTINVSLWLQKWDWATSYVVSEADLMGKDLYPILDRYYIQCVWNWRMSSNYLIVYPKSNFSCNYSFYALILLLCCIIFFFRMFHLFHWRISNTLERGALLHFNDTQDLNMKRSKRLDQSLYKCSLDVGLDMSSL